MDNTIEIQAMLIREQQAKIEVLTEQYNEVYAALRALQMALATHQINKAKNA